jgi:hypothetical protein
MHTDLPSEIREALHAQEITEDDLRYRELRRTSGRRFGGFAAAATAVACVAAVAVVVAAVNWPDDDKSGGGTPVAAGPGFADVLGYQWRVTGLTDQQGPLTIADAHGAMIGYTQHGYVVADDSVNSIGAHYRAVDGGYEVSDAATTLVGYAGDDPARVRTIAAVDAMFFTQSSDVPQVVQVMLNADSTTLTLVSGATTLTLARDGEQPELSDMAPATPSPKR